MCGGGYDNNPSSSGGGGIDIGYDAEANNNDADIYTYVQYAYSWIFNDHIGYDVVANNDDEHAFCVPYTFDPGRSSREWWMSISDNWSHHLFIGRALRGWRYQYQFKNYCNNQATHLLKLYESNESKG